MNRDLELLLRALEEVQSATPDNVLQVSRRFNVLVDTALEDRPGVNRDQFVRGLERRLVLLQRAEKRFPAV